MQWLTPSSFLFAPHLPFKFECEFFVACRLMSDINYICLVTRTSAMEHMMILLLLNISTCCSSFLNKLYLSMFIFMSCIFGTGRWRLCSCTSRKHDTWSCTSIFENGQQRLQLLLLLGFGTWCDLLTFRTGQHTPHLFVLQMHNLWCYPSISGTRR
jgi:hypothetical protein